MSCRSPLTFLACTPLSPQFSRCFTAFDPVFHRRNEVDRVGTFSAVAVIHAWQQIQTNTVIDRLLPKRINEALVIVVGSSVGTPTVGRSVIDDQCAAALDVG